MSYIMTRHISHRDWHISHVNVISHTVSNKEWTFSNFFNFSAWPRSTWKMQGLLQRTLMHPWRPTFCWRKGAPTFGSLDCLLSCVQPTSRRTSDHNWCFSKKFGTCKATGHFSIFFWGVPLVNQNVQLIRTTCSPCGPNCQSHHVRAQHQP